MADTQATGQDGKDAVLREVSTPVDPFVTVTVEGKGDWRRKQSPEKGPAKGFQMRFNFLRSHNREASRDRADNGNFISPTVESLLGAREDQTETGNRNFARAGWSLDSLAGTGPEQSLRLRATRGEVRSSYGDAFHMLRVSSRVEEVDLHSAPKGKEKNARKKKSASPVRKWSRDLAGRQRGRSASLSADEGGLQLRV
ncbi:hypothetical protein AXG93_1913s1760 [Marchantia polymorpha subsp. ruderalis]|uniref:Uncharacterized protein n=1 Tax=Marchantia polymorpha subsp. ruderalis TaxID=1480154 RepID=A0A176WJN3_MARPO|nr:hypothetical protein AXG93_1913s1760 [Marchantia polymorpha subsp. ruderalis]